MYRVLLLSLLISVGILLLRSYSTLFRVVIPSVGRKFFARDVSPYISVYGNVECIIILITPAPYGTCNVVKVAEFW